ncbi:MAG: MFS transporter [Akkermansiaceae bacterium]|nr:MFS transporter [Akkermansiaceae bacterium]
MKKIYSMFRALKYRNFRLFFPGLAVSQVGIWVQNIAISWLVYNLTQSPLTMGTVMFCNSLPFFLITPFAGFLIDKFNRHTLLMAVQILFAVQALLMTLITAAGLEAVWNIIALGVLLNAIAALDAPLRQSSFVCLVDDKRDLGNAISLNSSCFNLARFVGPALGGLLLAHAPISMCFLINFLCLAPAIILVGMMRMRDTRTPAAQRESFAESMRAGIRYAWGTRQIRYLLIYLSLFCFLIMSYPMLMPIYTAEVLHAEADVLGYLLGATGVGSLVASLLMAMKSGVSHLRWIILGGALLACLSLGGLACTQSVPAALTLSFLLGLGSTTFLTPENMLLQSVVADEKRGRVMSLNTLAYFAPTALSTLLAGSLAHALTLQGALLLLPAMMLVLAALLSFKLSTLRYH